MLCCFAHACVHALCWSYLSLLLYLARAQLCFTSASHITYCGASQASSRVI